MSSSQIINLRSGPPLDKPCVSALAYALEKVNYIPKRAKETTRTAEHESHGHIAPSVARGTLIPHWRRCCRGVRICLSQPWDVTTTRRFSSATTSRFCHTMDPPPHPSHLGGCDPAPKEPEAMGVRAVSRSHESEEFVGKAALVAV